MSVLALLLALPSAALWGPSVHAHLDEEHATEHHAGRVIHGHAPPHGSNGAHRLLTEPLVAGDEEEGADKVTTFLARECADPSPQAVIVPMAGTVNTPQPGAAVSPSFSTRNHGPPDSRLSRPRAPPA